MNVRRVVFFWVLVRVLKNKSPVWKEPSTFVIKNDYDKSENDIIQIDDETVMSLCQRPGSWRTYHSFDIGGYRDDCP